MTLSKDYGKHLYWSIYTTSDPVNEQYMYPWVVTDIKMYGYNMSEVVYNKTYEIFYNFYDTIKNYGIVYENTKEDTEI